MTEIIAEIAAAAQEQTAGIDEVNRAVTRMDSVSQSNAAENEEMASTAHSLASQAEQLRTLVGRFKLGATPARDTAGAASRPVAPLPAPATRGPEPELAYPHGGPEAGPPSPAPRAA